MGPTIPLCSPEAMLQQLKPQPCTITSPPLRAAGWDGIAWGLPAAQGEAGSLLCMTGASQAHRDGVRRDRAGRGEAAKPTAGREEVSGCEALVGGWCGILSAPHLRETPADSSLLAGLLLAAGKAALCSHWRGATAHMLQSVPVNQLLAPSPVVCMA